VVMKPSRLGELRGVSQALGRLIEATLRGSFLSWALHIEGTAADWLRADLDAVLRPYVTRREIHGG
jgi:hypothetical protein